MKQGHEASQFFYSLVDQAQRSALGDREIRLLLGKLAPAVQPGQMV